MHSMKSKNIDSELKSTIISESLKPNCVITELSRKYGISRTVIYNWRSRYKKSISHSGLESSSTVGKFVELSVMEKSNLNLQEVSLKFNNFSFSMQGQIKSSTLVSIIKMLEESC